MELLLQNSAHSKTMELLLKNSPHSNEQLVCEKRIFLTLFVGGVSIVLLLPIYYREMPFTIIQNSVGSTKWSPPLSGF